MQVENPMVLPNNGGRFEYDKEDPEVLGECVMTGEDIVEGDDYIELLDGSLMLDELEAMREYIKSEGGSFVSGQ